MLEIFAITIPVFALAGIGKLLSVKQVLTSENKKPLSWITYYLALPALIFTSFLKKGNVTIPVTSLLIISLLVILFSSLFTVLMMFLTKVKPTPEKRHAVIFTSYWGNNGYMGIPLTVSALGIAKGLPLAAVINGITVPFYIGISLVMMYRAIGHGEHKDKIRKEFLSTLFNPVIIAMITGAALSLLRPHIPPAITETPALKTLYFTLLATLSHLGNMGLPLALLLVGSNLKLSEVKSDKGLLFLSVFAKLIIAPATVYFLAKIFFTNLPKESFQALVLLNAVPGAVASYIISEKFHCAEDFTSSSLVISTLLSIITIPIWLHIIL